MSIDADSRKRVALLGKAGREVLRGGVLWWALGMEEHGVCGLGGCGVRRGAPVEVDHVRLVSAAVSLSCGSVMTGLQTKTNIASSKKASERARVFCIALSHPYLYTL